MILMHCTSIYLPMKFLVNTLNGLGRTHRWSDARYYRVLEGDMVHMKQAATILPKC